MTMHVPVDLLNGRMRRICLHDSCYLVLNFRGKEIVKWFEGGSKITKHFQFNMFK